MYYSNTLTCLFNTVPKSNTDHLRHVTKNDPDSLLKFTKNHYKCVFAQTVENCIKLVMKDSGIHIS